MTRIDHVRYRFECGAAAWHVRAVVLEERLNRPFRAGLRLVATEARDVGALLAAPAVLTFSRGDEVRVFRGEVTRAEVSCVGAGAHATVRFEPTPARLGWSTRSRIFQGKTALEIVREVIGAVVDLTLAPQLVAPRPALDYCVQYQESDLAFASRLLEQEAIAWLLDDSAESQVLRPRESDTPRDTCYQVCERPAPCFVLLPVNGSLYTPICLTLRRDGSRPSTHNHPGTTPS